MNKKILNPGRGRHLWGWKYIRLGVLLLLSLTWMTVVQAAAGQKPILRASEIAYPPYEYLEEDGRPNGFTVELTRAIAREMNMDIRIRPGPWSDILKQLERGKIDAVQGMFYSPDRDLKFDFNQSHTANHYVAVVRKGEGKPPAAPAELKGKQNNRKALLAQFSEGLKVLDETGEYRRIQEKWLGGNKETPLTLTGALRYSARVLIPLIVILLLFFMWSWLLRKQVAHRTEELAAVSERHRAILAAVPDIVMETDINKIYTWTNSAGIDFFGEDVIGREAADYFAGEQRNYNVVESLFNGDENVVYVESRQRRKDGQKRLLAWWCRVLKSKTGKVIGALATARDITEEKLAEAALRESEQKYRRITENITDVVWIMDLEFKTTYVSPSVERLLGDPADMHIQRTLEEKIPPDSLQKLHDVLTEEFEREKDPYCDKNRTRVIELQHYRADGSLIWIAVNVSFIRDEEGKHVAIQGVSRDITERKLAESTLQESEKKYRALFENSTDFVFTLDLDGNFTDVNRAAEILTGYSKKELIGMNYKKYIPADSHKRIFETFNKVFNEVRPLKDLPLEVIIKDGTGRYFETCVSPLMKGEDVISFQGSSRDITERIEAEAERERMSQQLTQAQKMESIGRLAGGVAHDFNNMLGVILGNAGLAIHSMATDDPLREELKEILKAAERSTDITRQLLAFARKQIISPEVLDLNGAMEGILKMLRRLIGEDIDLSWHPGQGLWSVKVDPAQIDQILANLVVNARDAIDGVGKINIETDMVHLDETYCADHAGFVPGDYVRLAVSDDGHGMDKKTLDNLFEPFFTTKERGEGTGLGLATVYGIVKQNSGFINVYSEPQKGTTFKIYLQRHEDKAERRADHAPRQIPQGQGETVLIVEDEPSILKLAKRVLSGLGYTVMEADTPEAALKMAENHPGKIDLLVTDVVLPEMNGRELAERLQRFDSDLKVLYMSGYTANTIAHRGVLEAGVNFIQKPFSNTDLGIKVRAALEAEIMHGKV